MSRFITWSIVIVVAVILGMVLFSKKEVNPSPDIKTSNDITSINNTTQEPVVRVDPNEPWKE